MGFSSTVYLHMLARLQNRTVQANAAVSDGSLESNANLDRRSVDGALRKYADAMGVPRDIDLEETPSSAARYSQQRSVIALDASGPTLVNVDDNEDKEPTYTTVHNGSVQPHTETEYAAWIYYDSHTEGSNFHVRASSNSGGGWSAAESLNGPRSVSGDPVCSSNNYVAGFNPQTVYCATLSYNIDADSAVQVWRKSGGGNWTRDEIPDQQNKAANGLFNDKPSINVSQDSNVAGAVYVAYTRVQTRICADPLNCPYPAPSIGFALYDQLGWRIRTNVPTPAGHVVTSPVVVSDPSNLTNSLYGTVYVVYVDWTDSALYVYRTRDEGATWEFQATVNATNYGAYFAAPNGRDPRICADRSTSNCIFAPTTLSARYNFNSSYPADTCALDGSIGMVLNAWGVYDPNSSPGAKMHSYFFRFNPKVSCGSPVATFDKIAVQLPDGNYDTWDPAIDFDRYGNYVVSRYQRTDSGSANINYKTAFTYLRNDGRTVGDIACPSCRVSDPTKYTKHGIYGYHLGEYQDIWYTTFLGRAGAVTLDIAGSEGDMAYYGVIPPPPPQNP